MNRIGTKTPRKMLTAPLLKANISTDATYYKAEGRPLNIAHRGLAGYFPENTIPAFEAALYAGADFIELDVVYTKDNRLLVMHDPFLHRITNAMVEDFPHAYEERYYHSDSKYFKSLWTDLLTLKELKSLRIKQKQYKHRISSLDEYFEMPTLQQVIEKVQLYNILHQGDTHPQGKIAGIMIQAKDGDMYRSRHPHKPSIASKILQVLEKYKLNTWQDSEKRMCPIFLQSFDEVTVQQWHQSGSNLPRHQLLQQSTLLFKTPSNLIDYTKKAVTYCHGIGVEDTMLYDIKKKQPRKDVLDAVRAQGLGLHVWTFKDDKLAFGAHDALRSYQIGQNQLHLDGVITQFCDSYRHIAQFLKKDKARKQEKQVVQSVQTRNIAEALA